MTTPGRNLYGMSIPGAPGVIIGHNDAISWGITNGMFDDADLFIEKINPENPNQYLDGDEWKSFDIRQEIIPVKGKESVILDVKLTRHGPIISDALESEPSHMLSFSWMGMQQGQEIPAILASGRATNWDDFRKFASLITCPGLNLIYADTMGNIGYQAAGKIPIRKNGIGRLPQPAWTGEYDWTGTVPFEENPHVLNPKEGYIATANNLIKEDFPYYVTNLWEPSDRIRRIDQLLQAQDLYSAEDLAAIQVDTYSFRASQVVPQILDCYTPEEVDFYKELTMLGRWDYDLRVHSEAASVTR